MDLMSIVSLLLQVVYAVPLVIGVILIGGRARGSARSLGVIGCVIMLVCAVLSIIWYWLLLPLVADNWGYSALQTMIPSAINGLVSTFGLVLVIMAVVAGRSSSALSTSLPPRPSGPSQPGPAPQQYPAAHPGPPPGSS